MTYRANASAAKLNTAKIQDAILSQGPPFGESGRPELPASPDNCSDRLNWQPAQGACPNLAIIFGGGNPPTISVGIVFIPIASLGLKTASVPNNECAETADCQTPITKRGAEDAVRFLERTKTRGGPVGNYDVGKPGKWRTFKANDALSEYGTKHVSALQLGPALMKK